MRTRLTTTRFCGWVVFLGVSLFSLDRWALAQLPADPTSKPTPTTVAQTTDESWQVIYMDQQRVGYEYGREAIERRDGRVVIVSSSESHSRLKRLGQELKLTTILQTEETEAGDLLRFNFELKNPPAQPTRTEGVVNNGELKLTSTVAGRTSSRHLTWEADAKSPAYPDRLLREKPLKPGESRTTKVYLPEFNKFSQITLSADDVRPVKLLDGKYQSLLKVRVAISAIPEQTSRQFVDTNGRTVLTETDMLGVAAKSYRVARDVALQAIAGAELDIAISTLIRIDPPITDAHRKKRIVYRISAKDEFPDKLLVNGGTQQVKRLSPDSIEVTVTSKPLPPTVFRQVATDAKYLATTRFLQVNDSRVVAHADKAAGGETDPSRVAARMERFVFEKLTKKNFSTAMASAAEVAEHLEGDCTEHAVLLAAMLRAKKIPSRIAAGLVYIPGVNSFGGHMWTEAFLGDEWIPLDATLGRTGIGAAHLKMSESALDEDAPFPVSAFLPLYQGLGKLKIEVLKAE